MSGLPSFALYIHIPYCIYRCPYCDFNVQAVTTAPEREYSRALLSELRHFAADPIWRDRPLSSIYFGGGTPSLFRADVISGIISAARESFPALPDCEISLEANPCTLNYELLAGYRQAGVNRLSLGAQSFSPKFLKLLGRSHSRDNIAASIGMARAAGLKNVSLDLIYALPEQNADEFEDDLAQAAALAPEHISAYTLTIEKGTPFFASVERGILKPASDEVQADFIERLIPFLARHGFAHYEISNFSRPGFTSRHNLSYWNGDDYLGLGAGAHSFNLLNRDPLEIAGVRRSNFASPAKYMSCVQGAESAVSWRDTLGRSDLAFEFFYLGLRKIAGVSLADFAMKFGAPLEELYRKDPLSELLADGFLARRGSHVALTTKGLLLYDSILQALILKDE